MGGESPEGPSPCCWGAAGAQSQSQAPRGPSVPGVSRDVVPPLAPPPASERQVCCQWVKKALFTEKMEASQTEKTCQTGYWSRL